MSNQGVRIDSIKFENVRFQYPDGPEIFSGLTGEIPTGTRHHVLGLAGNGQSTFLRLTAATLEPTSGAIQINGKSIHDLSFDEFMPIRLSIGLGFDSGGLLSNRTLFDNLMLPHLYHNISEPEVAEKDARELAMRLELNSSLDRRPAAVSVSSRRLATIVRALLLKPSLLILDDPFTGLETHTASELARVIEDYLNAGMIHTLLVSTRDLLWADRLACQPLTISRTRIGYNDELAALQLLNEKESVA